MATQDQTSNVQLRRPMNYYAVCDESKHAIIYISTQEECKRFIRDRELENCTIFHIHDIEMHTKRPIYLYEQE